MTDREQVIAELQYMKRDVLADSDKDITLNKAIAMLKEQEPKPVELHTNAYGTKFYFCPKCKRELFHTRNLNFCERCGQEVKWE